MKKKNRNPGKGLALVLTAVLGMSLLAGCKGGSIGSEGFRTAAVPQETEKDKEAEPLKERNEVPEDGIVTRGQMAGIAGKEGIYYFEGETEGGIAYQWAYNGQQIQNPVEQRLKVECTSDNLEEIQKAAKDAPYGLGVSLQDMEMAAPATLTLTLAEKWKADKVLFCTYEKGKIYQLSQGEISQVKRGKKKVSQISISVAKAGDTFYLVGGSTKSAKSQDTGESSEKGSKKKTSGNPSSSGSGSPQGGESPNQEGAGFYSGTPEGSDSQEGNFAGDESPSQSGGDTHGDIPGSGSGGESGGSSPEPAHTCTISIECSNILNKWDDLKSGKEEFVPSDGWILAPTEVEYSPGESVFDVLKRVCGDYGIQMESNYTPMYGSYYIEGINQLYEYDCGSNSGWMFSVNSWFPNYGCSSYTLSDGDVIEWRYTCDLGSDVGNPYTGGGN